MEEEGERKERLVKPLQSSFNYRITKNVSGRMIHVDSADIYVV